MQDEWWAETIRLYSAQSDATLFIQTAIESEDITVLSLAFDCLEEKLSVDPNVREQFEEKLLLGLESADEKRFRLSAETQLARRLDKLLRVDEKKSIDTSYITCAEYQLFLNEKRLLKEYYQPDHWGAHTFKKGMATEPITGIRASDANAFCQWLSTRTGQHYRLPYRNEIQAHPIINSSIHTWYLVQGGNGYSLAKTGNLLKQWETKVLTSLEERLRTDHASELSFARDLARARARDLARDLVGDLDLDLDFHIDQLLARVFKSVRDLAIARSPDLAIARAHDLTHDLDFNLVLDRGLAIDLNLPLRRARLRARALDGDTFRDLKYVHESTCTIMTELVLIYVLLVDAYEKSLSPQKWLLLVGDKRRRAQQYKQKYLRALNSLLDIYTFVVIVYLRRAGELPAWESMQIVREETE